MEITQLTIQDFDVWNQWVRAHTFPQRLTSTSHWPGQFFIIAVRDEHGHVIDGARVDVRKLWLGKKMWWVRQQVKTQNSKLKTHEMDKSYLLYLIQKARRENVVLIRIQSTEQPINVSMYQLIPPKFLFHVVDPEKTLMANLHFSEEELLSAMHPKTRYNIRRAHNAGVTVHDGSLDEFFSLYQATNARKRLGGYPREYFEALSYVPQPLSVRILTAHYHGAPLAASFLVGFGTTIFYLFGGSSDNERRVMAPHLMLWESMLQAKRNGYAWYDFGGISDTAPDWQSMTRFKRSFVSSRTGREMTLGKTHDIVIDPRWYHIFSYARRMYRK